MPDVEPVVAGVVAALAGCLAVWWAGVGRRPAVGPGEVTAVALVVAGWWADVWAPEVAVAVVLVILAGRAVDGGVPGAVSVRWGVVVAAALLVASDRWPPAERWLGVVAALAVVVLVWLAGAARQTMGDRTTYALVAWVPASAYLAVPDTEEVTAVAVAAGLVGVAVLWRDVAVRAGGIDALVVWVVWAAMTGARGREASIVVVGAAATLLVAPVLVAAQRRVRWGLPSAVGVALVAWLGGVVLPRWAGLGPDVGAAVARSAVVAIAMAVGVAMLVWRRSEAVA